MHLEFLLAILFLSTFTSLTQCLFIVVQPSKHIVCGSVGGDGKDGAESVAVEKVKYKYNYDLSRKLEVLQVVPHKVSFQEE